MNNYTFIVETLEAGQRRRYGDSFYSYKVRSNRPEHEVKSFCMNVLKKSFPKSEMPNPFAGELLEFEKLTSNNSSAFSTPRKDEEYTYRVRNEYTG